MIEQLPELIHEIEHNWIKKRLLVIGDVMLDRYIWGEVRRISPEAPVPVVLANHNSHQPGGAANVAMNLARLGARIKLIGFTGGDEDEALLSKCLHQEGIVSQFVVSSGYPTIAKLRIIGGRQQMLRLDTERIGQRGSSDYDRLISCILAQITECDAVVLSDYAKGVLTPEVCKAAIDAARKRDIPILVDPKCKDFRRYKGATTICPNLGELSAATGCDRHDLKTIFDAAESMLIPLDLEFMAATLSEKGIVLIRPGNHFLAPALARQVFDVSGAGDTVIAVLALCLASGLRPEASVQLANLAAGIVVGKVGTVPVEKHELLNALSPDIALNGTEKVVVPHELLVRVAQWRASGERIVFTNGCFDLLHIGHITVLEQSRRFGDRLVVAINSDASVSELKGPDRPIVGECERARVLAALAAVDAVVVFEQPTPLELILAVRPDIIVKGGDYDVDNVVGAREVQSWGGQVKIVPIIEGYSTSQLVEKSNRSAALS
jgi:D-beta-D-heptose 7-phosphate kinase / D-beta-D-heptose 1-phosphate adenosyltransferase